MKEVHTNVDNFSIGAHGSSMQTKAPIQTFVPLASVTHMM
jgi:hypothetical protein